LRTLSDCSSPSREHILSDKTYPNHFACFSDKRSPKGIACLGIDCCKIASEDLAIRHSQITTQLFSEFDRQIAIASLAIKERKIAESI
jgi:hypothetical protein